MTSAPVLQPDLAQAPEIQQLEAFFCKASRDPELFQSLSTVVGHADLSSLIADHGFTIPISYLEALESSVLEQSDRDISELSEDELEGVNGGVLPLFFGAVAMLAGRALISWAWGTFGESALSKPRP